MPQFFYKELFYTSSKLFLEVKYLCREDLKMKFTAIVVHNLHVPFIRLSMYDSTSYVFWCGFCVLIRNTYVAKTEVMSLLLQPVIWMYTRNVRSQCQICAAAIIQNDEDVATWRLIALEINSSVKVVHVDTKKYLDTYLVHFPYGK